MAATLRLPRRPTTSIPSSLFSPTTTTTTIPTITPPHFQQQPTPFSRTAVRHATLIRRPRRPYTFTQLVQLSDGSTYTHRTTSPLALYKSTKDTRNHVLWQPSEKTLRNVEVDEAGKLAAFRERFGRGWDAESKGDGEEGGGKGGAEGAEGGEGKKKRADGGSVGGGGGVDALSDLISGYSKPEPEVKEKVPLKRKK